MRFCTNEAAMKFNNAAKKLIQLTAGADFRSASPCLHCQEQEQSSTQAAALKQVCENPARRTTKQQKSAQTPHFGPTDKTNAWPTHILVEAHGGNICLFHLNLLPDLHVAHTESYARAENAET